MKSDLTVDSKINILLHKPNHVETYELDKNTPWIGELLNELNEKATDRSVEQYFENSELEVQLKTKRMEHQPFGPVLIVTGSIQSDFFTECVKSLKEMRDSIKVDFKACFIENHFAEDEEYADLDETFIDNDVHEIHFYENNIADIKEMIHEIIYLNIDQYPTLEESVPYEAMDTPSHTKQ